jgi:hypothetical protein
MSALTVAVQQTSNGSAPILDTDYPSSARNYIANVLATVLKPYNPLTIQQSAKAKRHPMCTTRLRLSPTCGHTW